MSPDTVTFTFEYDPSQPIELTKVVKAFHDQLIDRALGITSGSKYQAAILLGINRTTLVEKLRKRGMITTRPRRLFETLDQVDATIATGEASAGA